MDPLATLDAAQRALDCEDHAEAIDRLIDYYQYRVKALVVSNHGDQVRAMNQRAETLTTRAQDMRDRFAQAQDEQED